jgi:hypothetical protein
MSRGMAAITFYAYAFEGAPIVATRGWLVTPGTEHLVASHARTALGRAVTPRLWIYRCRGAIDGARMRCDQTQQIFDGNVDHDLQLFARFCARSVLADWSAPAIVGEYLRTGRSSLRAAAHRCASIVSECLVGTARIAARATLYAACEDEPVVAAREACRLAAQIGPLRVSIANQERALASALLALAATPLREVTATWRSPVPITT